MFGKKKDQFREGESVRRKRGLRTVRRVVVTIVVMVLLFLAAGTAYVYFSGKQTKHDEPPAAAKTEEVSGLPKPVQPAANAPVGVAVGALSTPVKIGANASLNVLTNATSKCTIVVTYGNVVYKDSGLDPKTADAYGNVTWTWTIGATVPVGEWPIKVTCAYNGRSAVVDTKQQVTK